MKISLAKCRNFNLHAKLQHIHNKKTGDQTNQTQFLKTVHIAK